MIFQKYLSAACGLQGFKRVYFIKEEWHIETDSVKFLENLTPPLHIF